MTATDTAAAADAKPAASAPPALGRAPAIALAAAVAATFGLSLALGPVLGPWAFLVAAMPVALWVAWSDMARMKIPNRAVLALVAVFAVLGPLVLGPEAWAWRWLHLATVLAIGFVLNMAGAFGAGDAKFAAAMAPFVGLPDAAAFCYLLAAVTIAAFAVHRTVRAIGPLRRLAPGWESWHRTDFPMGLALAGALVIHLALKAL